MEFLVDLKKNFGGISVELVKFVLVELLWNLGGIFFVEFVWNV